ncbi:PilZ domain-containing protein (plasmid) [Microvirga sp. VF16]|nr:PilZ domain-containing protein [Microvirga sp. VF16]
MAIEETLASERDRRWHRRQPLACHARVIVNDRMSDLTCTVDNLSAGGACIRFAGTVALPREFVLEIRSLSVRADVRLAWSGGTRHGVKFLWPQHRRCGSARAKPNIALADGPLARSV